VALLLVTSHIPNYPSAFSASSRMWSTGSLVRRSRSYCGSCCKNIYSTQSTASCPPASASQFHQQVRWLPAVEWLHNPYGMQQTVNFLIICHHMRGQQAVLEVDVLSGSTFATFFTLSTFTSVKSDSAM
jgi:hypothetical protein